MKKIVVYLIFMLLSPYGLSSSFDIKNFDLNQPKIESKLTPSTKLIIHGNEPYTLKLEKSLNEALIIDKALMNLFIHQLTVHGWLYSNSLQTSFSNAQNNDCEINISYQKNLNNVLLEDIHKDILFVFTHELSHCILGKDIFMKEIDWQYQLPLQTKIEIDKLIKIKTNEGIDELNAKIDTKKSIPMIVYHEMFADTMATIWLLSQNKINQDDIKAIIRERKNAYQFANKETAYVSFIPLDNLLKLLAQNPNLLKNKSLSQLHEIAILLTQKSFISYLMK